MDEFVCNSRAFGIRSENEIAIILSNFSTDYIIGAIEDILEKRISRFDPTPKPNFIASYEQSFKNMQSTYPSDISNIKEVRNNTYEDVINIICKNFSLEAEYQEDEDKYALAFYLFDFFISNYDIYLSHFFMQYIIKEKDNLYKALDLEEASKSKDVTTSFNRNLFSDVKLAVLAANLNKCINVALSIDFSMYDILSTAYDYQVTSMLCNHIKPIENFYKTAYIDAMINPNIWPLAATQIKFDLQNRAINNQL